MGSWRAGSSGKRAGAVLALAASVLAAVPGAPVVAATTVTSAQVSASVDATNATARQCEKAVVDLETCNVSTRSSSPVQGASGNSTAMAETELVPEGPDDLAVSLFGTAGGSAVSSDTRSAFATGSAATQVAFDIDGPAVVLIRGTLDNSVVDEPACSRLRLSGPGTDLDLHAPGSRCPAGGSVAGSIDRALLLAAGSYLLRADASASATIPRDGGFGGARGRYDIDVEVRACDDTPTEGADTLCGGSGDDIIDALGGADVVMGAGGADTITGGAGDDILRGGDGGDDISGGLGRDLLVGGADSDRLDGGDGVDELRGEGGSDDLFGRAYGDLLIGGPGRDHMEGGAGADDLRARDGSRDSVLGGSGRDIGRVDRVDRVSSVEVRR